MDMLRIAMPHLDRMIPLQANRFSFCGIGKSLPNKIRSHADGFPKGRIPGDKQKTSRFNSKKREPFLFYLFEYHPEKTKTADKSMIIDFFPRKKLTSK
jgi:hypothetical protein